ERAEVIHVPFHVFREVDHVEGVFFLQDLVHFPTATRLGQETFDLFWHPGNPHLVRFDPFYVLHRLQEGLVFVRLRWRWRGSGRTHRGTPLLFFGHADVALPDEVGQLPEELIDGLLLLHYHN